MFQAPLRKTALSLALVSVGLALGAMAQIPGTSTPGTTGQPSAAAGGAASDMPSGARAMGTDKSAPRGASDAKLARADRKFIEDAAKGEMAEVQFGQLAAQKAQSADVKQFGQRMADDHAKANDQLKQLATSKGVELPTDIDPSAKREHDRLSKLSGAAFDREYMNRMVSEHKKEVKGFGNESKSGKDADVKQFAASTLPTFEQHLQLAQQTAATVRTASRGSNTTKTSTTGSSAMTPGGTTSSGAATGAMTPGASGGATSGGTSGSANTSRKTGT